MLQHFNKILFIKWLLYYFVKSLFYIIVLDKYEIVICSMFIFILYFCIYMHLASKFKFIGTFVSIELFWWFCVIISSIIVLQYWHADN